MAQEDKKATRVRKDIVVGEVTPTLRENLIRDRWFSGEGDLWGLGFGKGKPAYLRAVDRIGAWLGGEAEVGGIYLRGEPVGMFSLEYLGDEKRTIRLFYFIAPPFRKFGVGWSGLKKVLDVAFARRLVHRVELELLTINSHQDFFSKAGFEVEGHKRYSHWMGPNGFNERILSILRPEWKRCSSIS